MTITIVEIVWLKGLTTQPDVDKRQPAKLFCDSKETLQIEANPVFHERAVFHERTKHIEIDYHFIKEKIQEGLIET